MYSWEKDNPVSKMAVMLLQKQRISVKKTTRNQIGSYASKPQG